MSKDEDVFPEDGQALPACFQVGAGDAARVAGPYRAMTHLGGVGVWGVSENGQPGPRMNSQTIKIA